MILVVGDVMADVTLHGVTRRSPETGGSIFAARSAALVPGGAANVALNVAALSEGEVVLVGVTGDDQTATGLIEALKREPRIDRRLIACPERITTLKQRLMVGDEQLMRLDFERVESLSAAAEAMMAPLLAAAVPCARAIVISDYGKGGVSPALAIALIAAARTTGAPTVVDTKSPTAPCWKGASLIKPNALEIGRALDKRPPRTDMEAAKAATELFDLIEVDHVLLTCGENGMVLADRAGATFVPAVEVDAVDVTGAGDSVAAALAAALADGAPILEAARFAAAAGAVAVTKRGTAVATRSEVMALAARNRHPGQPRCEDRAMAN